MAVRDLDSIGFCYMFTAGPIGSNRNTVVFDKSGTREHRLVVSSKRPHVIGPTELCPADSQYVHYSFAVQYPKGQTPTSRTDLTPGEAKFSTTLTRMPAMVGMPRQPHLFLQPP